MKTTIWMIVIIVYLAIGGIVDGIMNVGNDTSHGHFDGVDVLTIAFWPLFIIIVIGWWIHRLTELGEHIERDFDETD